MRSGDRDGGIADAIVVLGCRLKPDGSPSPALRRRVEYAAGLYESGAARVLLLSGGGPDAVPEAEVMRALALAAGVPGAAVLVETASRNTAENAFASAGLLRRHGMVRVILVTDRQHLPRARLLFRLAGLQVIGTAGVPAPSPVAAISHAIYEIAAFPLALLRASRWPEG